MVAADLARKEGDACTGRVTVAQEVRSDHPAPADVAALRRMRGRALALTTASA